MNGQRQKQLIFIFYSYFYVTRYRTQSPKLRKRSQHRCHSRRFLGSMVWTMSDDASFPLRIRRKITRSKSRKGKCRSKYGSRSTISYYGHTSSHSLQRWTDSRTSLWSSHARAISSAHEELCVNTILTPPSKESFFKNTILKNPLK